jgi:hypothetical protein
MNYKELTKIAQAQNKALMITIESLQSSLNSQSKTIASLTSEITELKNLLLSQGKSKEKAVNQLNGLLQIHLPKKTEKRNYVDTSLKSSAPAPTPQERGNNGAKRKVYNNLEEIIEEVNSTHPEFLDQMGKAKHLFSNDVIRYKFIPPRLIKHIYRCTSYRLDDVIYEGKAPISPFLNSNFDSSVIANLMQQRFIYGLPVERIVRYLAEMGMDIPKQTAHGLLAKGAELLDRLSPILKEAILSDDYLHFDETHHIVLDKSSDKGSRKGYFWVVLSNGLRLINYFIDERASRSRTAFTSYLPSSYRGAIQADGYASYKVLDGWEYKNTKRLGCIQHCKRKFLEIQGQEIASEFIDIYNQFYQIRSSYIKDVWVDKSKAVFEKLERRLREAEKSKEIITNSKLSTAVAYSLNELDSIRNIIESTAYELDNNSVERPMRYISISRKNSMFCGSVEGARRMALIYSLAVSCRLNEVNSFSYFCDVLNKLAEMPPNATSETLRNLLPDKWTLSE